MRFKGLDLNLLVTLQKLIETESVTMTARELNFSQPTISGALQRLRYHFKDEILISSGNRMRATSLAQSLAGPLAELLTEVDAFLMSSRSFDPAEARSRFVIHASDFVATIVLTQAFRAIAVAAPHLELSIMPLGDDPWAMLERGMVDLLIMPRQFMAPDHPSTPLLEDSNVIVGWSGNPLMAGPISEEAILSSPIIALSFGGRRRPTGGQYNSHLKARYVEEAQILLPSYALMAPLLVESDRLAVMPRRLARHYAKSFPLAIQEPIREPVRFDERMQYHGGRQQDAGLAWVMQQIAAAVPAQE